MPIKVVFRSVALLLPILGLVVGLSAQTKPQTSPAGILFEITRNDLKKPSYLFGTFHLVCPAEMLPLEKVTAEMAKADQVVMELDMDDPTEVQAMTKDLTMPDGKTLRDLLKPEEYQKVDELFKSVMGVSVGNLKSVKPTFLSVIISTSPKAIGCASPSSYDLALVKVAGESKKPILGLETAAFQVQALNYKPFDKQALDLLKIANDPQRSFDQMRDMVALYKTQDAEKLFEFTLAATTDDREFQTNLLANRNKDWLPKIEAHIAKTSSFIAVGGAHLGGPNGLLSLLRAKGYKLTAIRI